MIKSVAFSFALFSAALALAAPELFVGQTPASSGAFLVGDGTIPEYPSSVTVRRTTDNLTFEIRHDFAPGTVLPVKGTPDDPTKIFGGATAELFLAPYSETPGVYFQFAVNPSNVLYQAKGPDVSWRPAGKVATHIEIGADFWTATFVIPRGAFGEKPPAEGSRWGANFVCGGANWSGIGDLHSPLTFGHLVFMDAPPKAELASLSLRDGILRFSVLPDGRPDSVLVNGRTQPFPASGKAEFSLPLSSVLNETEIAHKALSPITIELANEGKPSATFQALAAVGNPDWLVLDKFYYEATNQLSIAYSVNCGLTKPTVTVHDLAGELRASFKAQPTNGIVTLTAPPAGTYVFAVSDGCKTASCTFTVTGPTSPSPAYSGLSLDSAFPRTLFAHDEKGTLTPIYPVLGDGLTSILSIPSCLSYGFTRTPTAGFLFDKVNAESFYGADAQLSRSPARPVSLNRICYEAQMAVILKNAAGETSICPSGATFFKGIYDGLKAKYPEKLFSIQIDSPIDPEIFASACDVFETAFWGSSYSATMLMRLPADLTSLRASAGEKPTILWLGGSIPSGRIRTADELNAAVHLCILRGVSGNVVHLGHGGVPKSRTRVWSFLKGIETETAKWYGEWIYAKEIPLSAEGEDIEFQARKKKDGKVILLAVNTSPFSRAFSYKDPATGKKHAVRLPGYGVLINR